MAPRDHTEVRVMAIGHRDFLRSFTPLGKHYRYAVDSNAGRIVIEDGPRRVEIHLGVETRRLLGALEMPSTEVSFTFHNFSKTELERFRERFDLCFRRGGG